MRAAVLVKQVPDVRAGSVGMRPDGTINRATARAITNPCDLHAIEAALQLAGDVTAISMGPPAAESTLREALAMGVDRAILLTDRIVAGSDTWATANALAAALAHTGPFDLILCGTSALDGETGQVGPQVATRMGLPQVTGCEAVEVGDGRVLVRRIVEGGYEIVRTSLPVVLTIAPVGFEPRYPTFPGRRRAAQAEVRVVTASEVGLSPDEVGLAASPTKVARMELVPLPEPNCRLVGPDVALSDLRAELEQRGALQPGVNRSPSPGCPEPAASHDGDRPAVWVAGEVVDDELAMVTCELIGKAAELAPEVGGGVGVFLAGDRLQGAAAEAASFGADRVFVAEDAELSPYRSQPHSRVLATAVTQFMPSIVLFGATSSGRELAPRVAAMLDTGLAADCTDLYVADWEHRGETYPRLLHQVRPAMSASVLATCVCPSARPQMATVRPGVFSAKPSNRQLRNTALRVDLEPADLAVEVVERHIERADVGIAEADVVVAGGAGCTRENWHLIESLAERLGGRVAASRGAVEAGLAPRALQVGQTGAAIRPRLYIACGISGALQHVVGMKGAETVIAINRDPEATIFRFADFGIVADVREGIPMLRDALAGALQS